MLCKWRHLKWEMLSVSVIRHTESKRNLAAFTSKTSSLNLNLLDITHKSRRCEVKSRSLFKCRFCLPIYDALRLTFFFLLVERRNSQLWVHETNIKPHDFCRLRTAPVEVFRECLRKYFFATRVPVGRRVNSGRLHANISIRRCMAWDQIKRFS